jgi:hypothetical protein
VTRRGQPGAPGESELLLEQGPQEIRELTRAVNVLVERLQSLEISRGRC